MFQFGTEILWNAVKIQENDAKLNEKTQGVGKTKNALSRNYVQFASLTYQANENITSF